MKNDIDGLIKKALDILGDTEISHTWDCQVDEHAFIASNVEFLLKKAKTEEDLKKVLAKIITGDGFQCEADHHFDSMSNIYELISDYLENS